MGAELLHTEGRTGRHDEANNGFCNFDKTPETVLNNLLRNCVFASTKATFFFLFPVVRVKREGHVWVKSTQWWPLGRLETDWNFVHTETHLHVIFYVIVWKWTIKFTWNLTSEFKINTLLTYRNPAVIMCINWCSITKFWVLPVRCNNQYRVTQ